MLLVVCTDGGKGNQGPIIIPAELAAIRQVEQQAVAKILEITEIVFLDHPDGEVSRAPDLVETLALHLRRHRPDRLVSWDPWKPYQLHPDHRAAGLAALDAGLAARGTRTTFRANRPTGCLRLKWDFVFGEVTTLTGGDFAAIAATTTATQEAHDFSRDFVAGPVTTILRLPDARSPVALLTVSRPSTRT